MLLSACLLSAEIDPQRYTVLARSHVWTPTNVAAMNLRQGPSGPGAFAPDATIPCDYLADDLPGRSPKFRCRTAPGDDIKVKFGAGNGEVYAEVAATRLLWALGFGADRMYPVRIVCSGCPDSIGQPGDDGHRIVDPATIERKSGDDLTSTDGQGWSWAELDLIDERRGGAPRAHRDALKLLAAFLQHTDSKREQQRLVCMDDRLPPGASGEPEATRPCARPLMLLDDVGLTFGRATLLNANAISAMNHREWAAAPVWKYATTCVGNLPRSLTGTLRDPVISEEGRQFLSALLMRLSDAQLRDLFDVARVGRRALASGATSDTATVQAWVDTFKRKREEIANRRCTEDWSSRAPLFFATTPNLWLQSWSSPALTAGMNLVSLLGQTPFYVLLAMVLAFTVNVRAGASMLVLLMLTTVLVSAAKTVVSYPRPMAVDHRITMLGPERAAAAADENDSGAYVPTWARVVAEKIGARPVALEMEDAYGFPSGHVATAMAFLSGLVFLFGWRGAWLGALVWVLLMALSRMYLGRHFLGDIIGGVAAGVVALITVVRALNLQRLRAGADRRVLLKTAGTAAMCIALSVAGSIPSPYHAGLLTGAVIALVSISYGAPAGYDHASAVVRGGRLAAAMTCAGLTWLGTTVYLQGYAGEAGAAHAFGIGAIRTVVLLWPVVFIECSGVWLRGALQRRLDRHAI